MAQPAMTESEVHDLLHRLFAALADPAATAEQFAELLTPDYIQRVDGKEIDYAGFISHIEALRTHLASVDITFQHIVTDGRSAATVHLVDAVKTSGQRSRFKVIAYYQFRGKRVCLIDELTHLIEGEAEDRDLGSRVAE
ncbi:nuclear transport factor 2 family protein [Brucella sp. IR073]|uniref:nuclear transport factor 2 family protein n=1 Tax=unclassified Brucella TaxID=2632610 RepID=UPI003B97FFCF